MLNVMSKKPDGRLPGDNLQEREAGTVLRRYNVSKKSAAKTLDCHCCGSASCCAIDSVFGNSNTCSSSDSRQ